MSLVKISCIIRYKKNSTDSRNAIYYSNLFENVLNAIKYHINHLKHL